MGSVSVDNSSYRAPQACAANFMVCVGYYAAQQQAQHEVPRKLSNNVFNAHGDMAVSVDSLMGYVVRI